MNFTTLLLSVGVVVIYGAAIIGVIAWTRWQRKTRWPFNTDDRLLRGPGEHLRRRLTEFEEQFLFEFVGGNAGILLALVFCADTLRKFFTWTPAQAAWIALATGAAVMAVSLWRIRRLWQNRTNHYLGWFGERVVGEQLQLATVQGWRIFHDVPSDTGNLDHVAVGLGGVFVIETKARRKGKARPGFKDNVVFFDGRDLVWPWGEDNHGLAQAERNASWLAGWIKREIGEQVQVSPLLVLPGWWLENKPTKESRLCRVVNPKWLPDLLARERPMLTPKQVELIALRLDARCRDVED